MNAKAIVLLTEPRQYVSPLKVSFWSCHHMCDCPPEFGLLFSFHNCATIDMCP